MSEQPEDVRPTEPASSPKPSTVIGGVIGLVTIVIVAVSCANMVVDADKDMEAAVAAAAPFDLTGELALPSSGVFIAGTACTGTGGYGDIEEGTQVAVYDADGKVLAKGALKEGVVRQADCIFRFTVRAVPGSEEILQVEVARRGKVLTSPWEAKAGPVKLNLGR